MTPALIEIDDLHKRFGAINAVDGISLRVPQGEVLGFLGPNGAGKTTTMRMIAGFIAPDSGTARIGGYDAQRQPIEARRRLGYLPEGAPAYPEMTVTALLRFAARLHRFAGREQSHQVERAIGLAQLETVRTQRIETLSKGYKRRVGLAMALLHDPPALVMDEPTDGLDPNQKHDVRALISGMAAEKAIIISTHLLEEVDAVCTRAVIIAAGRIVADGTPEELRRFHPSGRLDEVFRTLTLAAAERAAKQAA